MFSVVFEEDLLNKFVVKEQIDFRKEVELFNLGFNELLGELVMKFKSFLLGDSLFSLLLMDMASLFPFNVALFAILIFYKANRF